MTAKASPNDLIIGASDANHVSLRLLGRAHPESTDFWDGNWLKVDVAARAGSFHGTFEADLRSDEFQRFADELRTLTPAPRSEAKLESMEGWVALRLVVDERGRLEGTCEVRDDPTTGTSLRFRVSSDQAQVAALLGALDRILAAFPVIGQPDEDAGDRLALLGDGDGDDDGA